MHDQARLAKHAIQGWLRLLLHRHTLAVMDHPSKRWYSLAMTP